MSSQLIYGKRDSDVKIIDGNCVTAFLLPNT